MQTAGAPKLIELRKVDAQLEAIKRSDGHLPTVTGGQVPLLNLDPNQLERRAQ